MARASSKKPRSSSSKRGSSKSSKKKQAAKNDTKVLRGTLKKSRSKNKRAANRDSKHHKYYHRSSSDDSSDEGGMDLKVKRKKRSKSKQRSRSSSKETKSSIASRHSGYHNNEVRPRPPVVFPTSPPLTIFANTKMKISREEMKNMIRVITAQTTAQNGYTQTTKTWRLTTTRHRPSWQWLGW